jgi:hypothetical protein
MREKMMNFNHKTEMKNHLPEDLLPKVTILLQDTGYVTISPIELNRDEWRRFNEKVKQMTARELKGLRFLEMRDQC